jgi:hypothetical protein
MKKDREKLDLAPAHTAWAELDAALLTAKRRKNGLDDGRRFDYQQTRHTSSYRSFRALLLV